MMKEAESHAEEDKKRKEEIETRNHADQAVYGAERTLQGRRATSSRRRPGGRSRRRSNDLKSAIEKNDTAAMKKRMEALNQAQHKAAEAMYRRRARPAPGRRPAPAEQPGGAAGGQTPSGAAAGRRHRRGGRGRGEEVANGCDPVTR